MRSLLVGGAAILAACQPLYKGKPAKLREPDPLVKKDEPKAPEKPTLVVECSVERASPAKVVKEPARIESARLTNEATSELGKAKTAEPDDRGTKLRKSVEDYRTALQADPYNVDATLGLARAYELGQRQGCALVMLNRLYALSTNQALPNVATAATAAIDQVVANRTWFQPYRDDAKAALKR
jgi:hypothetical protein